MNSLSYSLQLLLRLVAMIGVTVSLVLLLAFTSLYAISLIVGLVLVGLIAELFQFLNRSNRDVTAFLEGIRVDDYSTSYQRRIQSGAFQSLYQEIEQIRADFQKIRTEKEMQYLYLQTLVEHVEVGLLCFSAEEEIVLMNQALQRMLRQPYLPKLRGLTRISEELYHTVKTLPAGEEALVRVLVDDELMQLSVRATEFKLQDASFSLVSLQNIRRELEARDLQAWQRLIRILTHEIMNSATPLSSLSETLLELLEEESAWEDPETQQDTVEGLQAIHHRAKGLLHFTTAYRNLTRVPEPNWEVVQLRPWLQDILTLMRPKCEKAGVEVEVQWPDPQLETRMDPKLMAQVMINLIQNACQAMGDMTDARLILRIFSSEKGLFMEVSDNGPGISEAQQEEIFVPFFTTKAEGSGIGLSLSQQIVQAHRGRLSVRSKAGEGATFSILL